MRIMCKFNHFDYRFHLANFQKTSNIIANLTDLLLIYFDLVLVDRDPLYYFSMILHSLAKSVDGNNIRLEETLYFNTLSELMQSLSGKCSSFCLKKHISKSIEI